MPKLAVTPPRPARPDDALDRAAHPLGEDVRAVLVGVRGEDRELLAADPGGGVPAALALLERVADRPQHLVAGGVPELVVHLLEVVEVADDHAERLLGAAGALELDVERPPGTRAGSAGPVSGSRRAASLRLEITSLRRSRTIGDQQPDQQERADRDRPLGDRACSRGRGPPARAANRSADQRRLGKRGAAAEEPEGVDDRPEVGHRPVEGASPGVVDRGRGEHRGAGHQQRGRSSAAARRTRRSRAAAMAAASAPHEAQPRLVDGRGVGERHRRATPPARPRRAEPEHGTRHGRPARGSRDARGVLCPPAEPVPEWRVHAPLFRW